ncbi:ABC transporter substrate binding protein [uncultured Desulfobacter sp.]|uniref:ABC transporter substrate-binding protein n=1 Tax=uncultured Desulfobacter sp. TaxID=240139 RepID=UPI002AAAAFD8|nr:ABC transporter substrate binding protein [uncultured Desulfobacter sp.]
MYPRMCKRQIAVTTAALGFFIMIACTGSAGTTVIADRTPTPNNGHEKWRIAYYEGGAYVDYTDSMRAIIKGLMEYGWIERAILPNIRGDVEKPYWNWLATKAQSKRLSFYKEDAFSAGWSSEQRDMVRKEVLTLLKSNKIDLVIAMGTWAGQDLATPEHHVPTIVTSTSNPIEAKIIKSARDSGLDHVTARVDPSRYLRQIRMFHRIVGFKTLGVVYENSDEGRIYAAVKELEQVAQERGFSLVRCFFTDQTEDRETSDRQCMECMEQIAEKADAVYLPAMLAIDEQICQISEMLKAKRIPSFSMLGSKHVAKGILLSVSTDEGHHTQGRYEAKKIIDILIGVRPRDLNQISPDPLDPAVNMDTAKAIGFEVPAGILRIAKKFYDNICQ